MSLVASLLNIVAFTVFGSFAQLTAATSRVTILAYTMPIWAVLLAWLFLGERPNRVQGIALGLCAAGLAVLIYPLAATKIRREFCWRCSLACAGRPARSISNGRRSKPIRWGSQAGR